MKAQTSREYAGATPEGTVQCASRSLAKKTEDRKSTRLNSSHLVISYAVFCLKKKKQKERELTMLVLIDILIVRRETVGRTKHRHALERSVTARFHNSDGASAATCITRVVRT